MLHACVQTFDVMGRKVFGWELNRALITGILDCLSHKSRESPSFLLSQSMHCVYFSEVVMATDILK